MANIFDASKLFLQSEGHAGAPANIWYYTDDQNNIADMNKNGFFPTSLSRVFSNDITQGDIIIVWGMDGFQNLGVMDGNGTVFAF